MNASQKLKVSWKDIPTRTITAGGVEFAYRELGTDKPWSAAEFERIDRQIEPIWIGLARELNTTLD